jgi:hypothetical protein
MTRSVVARRWVFFSVLGAALSCACGEPPPFGGPHGGDATRLPPTAGWIPGTTYTPPAPPPPPAGGNPGTWYHIFTSYFEVGTVGDCPTCHAEMKTSKASYTWLRELEYIGATPPPLIDFGSSCLAWFGGNMPPGLVPQNDALIAEFETWAKAGAKED